MDGEILVIPELTFTLGLKVSQSRITVDRAQQYKFAVALENFVTGKISAASRQIDAVLTNLTELAPTAPPSDDQQPLVNGSVMRVVLKALFPFDEMKGLSPVPIASVRRPVVSSPIPEPVE
jgi:hypothetical protein